MNEFETGVCVGILLQKRGHNANLSSVTFTANDTYTPTAPLDGWNEVTVNVKTWYDEYQQMLQCCDEVQDAIIANWDPDDPDPPTKPIPPADIPGLIDQLPGYTFPPGTTFEDIYEMSPADPPTFVYDGECSIQWKVYQIPYDGTVHTITFGDTTISAYCGTMVQVWLNGAEYSMEGEYYSWDNPSYTYISIDNMELVPESQGQYPSLQFDLTYNGGVQITSHETVSFPLDTPVTAHSDADGWRVRN